MALKVWSAPPQASRLARLVLALSLVVGIGFTHVGSAAAEPAYPQLTGRITDEAGLLSAADRSDQADDGSGQGASHRISSELWDSSAWAGGSDSRGRGCTLRLSSKATVFRNVGWLT